VAGAFGVIAQRWCADPHGSASIDLVLRVAIPDRHGDLCDYLWVHVDEPAGLDVTTLTGVTITAR
jgi:hypothetical protein